MSSHVSWEMAGVVPATVNKRAQAQDFRSHPKVHSCDSRQVSKAYEGQRKLIRESPVRRKSPLNAAKRLQVSFSCVPQPIQTEVRAANDTYLAFRVVSDNDDVQRAAATAAEDDNKMRLQTELSTTSTFPPKQPLLIWIDLPPPSATARGLYADAAARAHPPPHPTGPHLLQAQQGRTLPSKRQVWDLSISSAFLMSLASTCFIIVAVAIAYLASAKLQVTAYSPYLYNRVSFHTAAAYFRSCSVRIAVRIPPWHCSRRTRHACCRSLQMKIT